jgi:hypothetical protein
MGCSLWFYHPKLIWMGYYIIYILIYNVYIIYYYHYLLLLWFSLAICSTIFHTSEVRTRPLSRRVVGEELSGL